MRASGDGPFIHVRAIIVAFGRVDVLIIAVISIYATCIQTTRVKRRVTQQKKHTCASILGFDIGQDSLNEALNGPGILVIIVKPRVRFYDLHCDKLLACG